MRIGCWGPVVGIAGLLLLQSARADEATAKKKLADLGIRVTSSGLTLTEEIKLNQGFSEMASLKRKLTSAAKVLRSAENDEHGIDEQMSELLAENVQINSQLSRTNTANALAYNRLVAAVNANQAQLKLLSDQRERFHKELESTRQDANAVRENYMQHIIELRKSTSEVEKKYTELGKNADATAALAEWNAAAKTNLKLEPSRTFAANQKKLEAIEKSVLTERISLRREGNSFFASVVIDGKSANEMIVDSGASLISLPYKMALAAGIDVSDSDREITLVIANGAKIKGKIKTLDTVRVGKFTAENVECAILGPEATDAKPLLGMSFLGRFKFELDAQTSELSLLKVDAETIGGKPTPAAKSKPAKAKSAPKAARSKSAKSKSAQPQSADAEPSDSP